MCLLFFFFNDTATTEIYTLSLHDALPISERRTLNVVLAPESLRGAAFLVQDDGAASDVQWLYIPAIGRVRRLVSPEAYSAFLNSDFTYADLGFVDTGARYRLLGTKTYDGTRTLEI